MRVLKVSELLKAKYPWAKILLPAVKLKFGKIISLSDMLKKIALLVIFMLTCCGVSFADTQTLALIKELEGKLSGVKTLETDFIQKKKEIESLQYKTSDC